MKRNVLITGANGFLGSALVRKLSSENEFRLVGVYRNGQDRLLKEKRGRLNYVRGDLGDRNAVFAMFEAFPIEAIVHTAAAVSSRNDEGYLAEALRDNIQSQANLVYAALEHGCRRFVFCSTIGVYGGPLRRRRGFREKDPASPSEVYGWSKYSAESLLRLHVESSGSMQGVTLRFAGIHGPGRESGVIYNLLRTALDGKTVTLTEPGSRFRFLFVDDAVQAIRLALLKDLREKYTCFNVAGREITALGKLADMAKRLPGSRCRVDIRDGGRLRNQVLDIGKIRSELGFSPGALNERLQAFHGYLRKRSGG